MSTIWQRSKVANLIRHHGGRYYGRFTVSGKTKFIALRSDVFALAKIQLDRERLKIDRTRNAQRALADGRPTMGDLHTI